MKPRNGHWTSEATVSLYLSLPKETHFLQMNTKTGFYLHLSFPTPLSALHIVVEEEEHQRGHKPRSQIYRSSMLLVFFHLSLHLLKQPRVLIHYIWKPVKLHWQPLIDISCLLLDFPFLSPLYIVEVRPNNIFTNFNQIEQIRVPRRKNKLSEEKIKQVDGQFSDCLQVQLQ